MKFKMLVTIVIFNLVNLSVYAHPGHGEAEHQHGFMHYITAPEHFLPIIAVLVVLGYFVYKFGFVQRKEQKQHVE